MIATRTITPPTNRQLHALLSQSGNMQHKGELVSGFTSGRTIHSSEMLEYEAINMIKWLKEQIEEMKQYNVANMMRRKILAICHTLGWYVRDENDTLKLQQGKPVLDWQRINRFCCERTKYKKPLRELSASELPSVITSFERLLKSDLK
jgi:NADH pyrophosphatase NudC (nudix superfamily)